MSLSLKRTERVFELAAVMSALDGGLTSIQHVASLYLALFVRFPIPVERLSFNTGKTSKVLTGVRVRVPSRGPHFKQGNRRSTTRPNVCARLI